jgi:predicted enzyme related to lactoylglutathione lyase
MKIEKLVQVAIGVKDIDKAEKFFSDLFEITFDRSPQHDVVRTPTENADEAFKKNKFKGVAMSTLGIELVQPDPPLEKEGLRAFHLKVANIEEAKAEMKKRGIPLLGVQTHGGLKEAIYDIYGARIVLVEYDAATPIKAIFQK